MRHVLLFAALICAPISNAATVNFSGVTPTNVFNYQLLISNERLMSGDYFVIYDFAGIQSTAAPANWATQITPNDASASNDVTMSDIRFTYSGSTLTSNSGRPDDVQTLTGFTITSSSSLTRQDSYYALTTKKSNDHDLVQNGVTTVADLFVPPPPAPVPEPSTLTLLGGGLALIPLVRRRFMAGDK